MFSLRLKQLREDAGYSQYSFASAFGVAQSTIGNWEAGKREPKYEVIVRLANFFGVSVDYLLGREDAVRPQEEELPSLDNLLPIPKMNKVPLVGTIACGTPVLAQENIEDWVNMPEGVHADFALRCKGDSMINARIHDGDIVFIRRQDDVLDRQIAAVLIDDEATLKRVQHMANGAILLQAENPAYPPLLCGGPNETREIRIIGLATHFLSVAK